MPVELTIWQPQKTSNNTKMLVYGASGVGKTMLASTAPKPLFLDANKGMSSIVVEGVARIEINHWEDIRDAWPIIANDERFETIVVDGLNDIQRLSLRHVVGSYPNRRYYDDMPTQADWGKSLEDLQRLIEAFTSLQRNVVYTCFSTHVELEGDRVRPQMGGKNTWNMVTSYMDAVGYMYIVRDEKGAAQRVLAFDSPTAVTKNRTHVLPDVAYDPTWNKLFNVKEPPQVEFTKPKARSRKAAEPEEQPSQEQPQEAQAADHPDEQAAPEGQDSLEETQNA